VAATPAPATKGVEGCDFSLLSRDYPDARRASVMLGYVSRGVDVRWLVC